jgi:hypothetical protein
MKPMQPTYAVTTTRKLAVMEEKHMYDWETESMPYAYITHRPLTGVGTAVSTS